MAQEAHFNIERVLARVGDLPAMPQVVAEALDMTSDPDVDIEMLTRKLETDPGLTARILRVSNSPYFGMRQYVGTLKLALVILGMRETRNIVLGVSLVGMFRDDPSASVLAKDFWSHSLLTAGICKKLCDRLGVQAEGEEFIAGLLHDIGKMILCRQLQKEYVSLYQAAGGFGDALLAAEKAQLGFTHADAGAALASKWNLPTTLSDALRLHHPSAETPLAAAKDPKLVALVRISNLAARDSFEAPEEGAACCRDDEGWAALDATPAPITPVARFETLAGIVRKLKSAPLAAS